MKAREFQLGLIDLVETSEGWDILTMLRSLDEDIPKAYQLKDLTVARLRGFLLGERGVNGNWYNEYKFDVRTAVLLPEERIEREKLLKTTPQHYRGHWVAAVYSVKSIFGYDLDTETVCHKDKYRTWLSSK